MTAPTAALPPSSRLAVLASGAGLSAAALVVAIADPSAPGSRFPPCSFHRVTGWWCPGCGLTRGTHHLLHGDLIAAMGSNLFTPLVAVAVVTTWFAWARRSFGRRPTRWATAAIARRDRWRGWTASLLTVAVVYSVLRNIPTAPFEALAP
jgi:hypothetical protein